MTYWQERISSLFGNKLQRPSRGLEHELDVERRPAAARDHTGGLQTFTHWGASRTSRESIEGECHRRVSIGVGRCLFMASTDTEVTSSNAICPRALPHCVHTTHLLQGAVQQLGGRLTSPHLHPPLIIGSVTAHPAPLHKVKVQPRSRLRRFGCRIGGWVTTSSDIQNHLPASVGVVTPPRLLPI